MARIARPRRLRDSPTPGRQREHPRRQPKATQASHQSPRRGREKTDDRATYIKVSLDDLQPWASATGCFAREAATCPCAEEARPGNRESAPTRTRSSRGRPRQCRDLLHQ